MGQALAKTQPIDLKMMIGQLENLTRQTAENRYEIGRICSAIRYNNLYEMLGYKSVVAFVDEKLTMCYTTFFNYATLYDEFSSIGYNKKEAINIMGAVATRPLLRVLASIEKKLSLRMIKRRIEDNNFDEYHDKFSITTHNQTETDRVVRALKTHGMEMPDGDYKIRRNINSALLAMVKDYERLKKAENAKKSKAKIKAVA